MQNEKTPLNDNSLMARVKKLIGVEVIPEAVENARLNAEQNGVKNAEFICSKAEDCTFPSPDVLLVDPPRKGCDEALLETVSKMSPERVVYVSCDSATLARDCGRFLDYGYTVAEATPVDMFPRTGNVEVVALLQQLSLPDGK